MKLFAYQHIQGASTTGNRKYTMVTLREETAPEDPEVAKLCQEKKNEKGRVQKNGNDLGKREQTKAMLGCGNQPRL